jgi:putative toxin-antitoxin system antitoxin component (TIGR02293 family)
MNTLPHDQQANFSEVLHAALSLFGGDMEAARDWMLKPVRVLGSKTPASMAATRAESDVVLDFIRRIEHGFGA